MTFEELQRSRDAWQETARFHCNNEAYWRGLVMQIGDLFGDDAKRSDDGSMQEDPIGPRVVELVQKMVSERRSA